MEEEEVFFDAIETMAVAVDETINFSMAMSMFGEHTNRREQQLYREALSSGSIKVDIIRVMVIGHQGVGKTSLVKRLIGEEANENEIKSTEGIDFHHLQINHGTGEWSKTDSDRAKLNKHTMLEVLHKYDKNKGTLPSECAINTDNGGNCIEQTSKDKSATGKIASANVLDGNIKTENKGKGTKPFQTNLEIRQLVREAKTFSPRGILSSPLTIMDFAGQFLYYTTHQTFISWRTIYLLVTDLSRPLGDPVTKDSSNLVGGVNEPCSIQDHVVYWLNSVHSHVFLPIELDPTQIQGDVILVGTHLDVIPKDLVEKKKKEHFEQIRELVKDRPLRYHLVDTEFAVTNIEYDPTIEALKKKIVELAQKQGTTIPARWLALENALLKLAKEGKKVIPYTDVEDLNESLEVKLNSNDELDAFLKFEHELGHCIFFGTEILRAHVMLDPKWLLEGLRIWITSDEFIKKHPKFTDQWYNFTKTGRLTEELIELLWSEHPELYVHQKHLLSVMEKLNIIAKVPVEDKQSAKDRFYWVPCMVHRSVSEYSKTLLEGEDVIMTPALCFVSKSNFIHVGVFHRLLASCLTKWQPCKKGDEYLIYSGLCEFELNKDHVLVLSLNDYVIQANVIRYSKRKDNPELSLCITTREYLFTALREIADLLCPACDIDIYIKCPKTSPLSNEGLHKIKDLQDNYEIRCAKHKRGAHCIRSDDLLGFWEGKGANVPTIVQTAESAYATNRFMKIFSLLVDVGSQVLRELLKVMAAKENRTFDEYLQDKKPDIEALRNKVFYKVQMDKMYPSNGHTDLGKYDITHSSALLLNIFPSIDEQVKQKIKVVREERNNFSHPMSTKLSHSEYQTKWTKVTTILIELSNLCDGSTIKTDIYTEIQQIMEFGFDDLKSVFEKYNEDLKRDMNATLDTFDESQKKDIEVRLIRYKEDLENEMEAKLNNYKAEIDMRIENLKVDVKSWLDKQIHD